MSERVEDWISDIIEMARDQRADGGFELTTTEVISNAMVDVPTVLRANPTTSQAIAAVEEMRGEWAKSDAESHEIFSAAFSYMQAADEILAKLRTLPQPEPDEVSEAEVEAASRAIMLSEGCGLSLQGNHVFCDDPSLPDDFRNEVCTCKEAGRAALEAARAARRGAR